MSDFWICEIQKSDIPPPEKSKKIRGFANFELKFRPFSAIFGVKNTLVNPSIFLFFERDFGQILDILPYYTYGFF